MMKLQNKLIFPILFFGCLLYFLTGLFPFTHYETDAMGVVAGCKHIIDTGVFSANYYTYSFEMQPGIYFWIILVHKIFGTNLVVTYSIISAFFGVASLFISAYFISIITKANYYLIGIVLLLFQEMYSSWYYMNSATGAAFFLILGLTVVANTSSHYTYRFLLSASLLALSAWIRFDVVIVFPAVILLIKSDNLKKKFIWACIIGVITVFLMNYLYGLSHVSLYALFSENAGGNGIQIADNLKTSGGLFSSQMMRSIIGFFSILILFLMSVGSFYLYKKKQWRELALTYLPVILFLIILKGNFTAGKHLLYYLPLTAIPVTVAIIEVLTLERNGFKLVVTSLSILLFVGQYIIGFQFFLKSHPYISQEYSTVYPEPTYLHLLKIKPERGPLDSIAIVLGSGMKLATADEMLLSSGIIYSPMMWQKLKNDSKQIYNSLFYFVSNYQKDTLYITTSQGGAYSIKNILYLDGYHLVNPESNVYQWGADYSYVWKRANKYVIVEQAIYPKNYEQYIAKLKNIKHKTFLHLAFWDWERWYMNTNYNDLSKINNAGFILKVDVVTK